MFLANLCNVGLKQDISPAVPAVDEQKKTAFTNAHEAVTLRGVAGGRQPDVDLTWFPVFGTLPPMKLRLQTVLGRPATRTSRGGLKSNFLLIRGRWYRYGIVC